MKAKNLTYSAALFVLGAACTPALPHEEPEEVYYQTLTASQEVLQRVEDTAAECANESSRAQAALQEARRILAEAKKLEHHCQKLVKRIPKPKPKKKKQEQTTPLIAVPAEEKKKQMFQDKRMKPNIYNTQNLGEPMFSPSDAPDFARPKPDPKKPDAPKAEQKEEPKKDAHAH